MLQIVTYPINNSIFIYQHIIIFICLNKRGYDVDWLLSLNNSEIYSCLETCPFISHCKNMSNFVKIGPWAFFSPRFKNKIMLFLHGFWHDYIYILTNNQIPLISKSLLNIFGHIINNAHVAFLNFWFKAYGILLKKK